MTDCIEHTGALNVPNGYPRIRVDGKRYTANAYYCELYHGPKPAPGMMALHSCDNKRCINREHLSWGSRSKNMKECRDRLQPKQQTLTPEEVEDIKSSSLTGRALAKVYGVHESTISLIRNNKTWRA